MPFGPYQNFKACISANKSKGDPEAYCATIMRKIEGKQAKAEIATNEYDCSSLKKLGSGSDRIVYELPGNQVLKVAKTARGLLQNKLEGDTLLNANIPKLIERGEDYVVVEKVERDDKKSEKLLEPLKQFSEDDFAKKTPELQEAFSTLDKEYKGFSNYLKHNLLWGDFLEERNWGWEGETPILLDAGTLDAQILDQKAIDTKTPEWKAIQRAKIGNAWKSATHTKSAPMAYYEAKHEDTEEYFKMFDQERKEHPSFTDDQVKQIVLDHMKKNALHAHLSKMPKENRLKLIKHWKVTVAKHSELAQVPEDYEKHLHGQNPEKKIAMHSSIGMPVYADVKLAFMTEGEYHANSEDPTKYFYPWDVIKRDAPSWEGEPFFINHSDNNGTEIGLVKQIYFDRIEGKDWACAVVKVPEIGLTKSQLDRIQTGLITEISTTHEFLVGKDGRTVQKISGKGITTVSEGEVTGAHILDIERNKKDSVMMRKIIGKQWKKRSLNG